MTKHQMSAEVFIVVSFRKEIRQGCPLLFLKRNNNKNFSWYLVFSHWFLVNGLSNGKDIYVVLLVKLSNDCRCSLDELPKRVTMKVIKVKTIKMALGMIIVAASGASKFNQHLKLSLIIRFIVFFYFWEKSSRCTTCSSTPNLESTNPDFSPQNLLFVLSY